MCYCQMLFLGSVAVMLTHSCFPKRTWTYAPDQCWFCSLLNNPTAWLLAEKVHPYLRRSTRHWRRFCTLRNAVVSRDHLGLIWGSLASFRERRLARSSLRLSNLSAFNILNAECFTQPQLLDVFHLSTQTCLDKSVDAGLPEVFLDYVHSYMMALAALFLGFFSGIFGDSHYQVSSVTEALPDRQPVTAGRGPASFGSDDATAFKVHTWCPLFRLALLKKVTMSCTD